jgi:hypothetical protein
MYYLLNIDIKIKIKPEDQEAIIYNIYVCVNQA